MFSLDNDCRIGFVAGTIEIITFTDCTIWFGQRVATMNDTIDQGLFGVFVVTSVWVAYAIAAS